MYICRIYISYIYTYVYSARPNQWFMFPYWWIDFRKVFYLSFSTNMSNPVPGIFFSRIWSSAEYHVVLVLLLNLVGFFISTQPKWSGGNVLYKWGTSPEWASRGDQPLTIFAWFMGSGVYSNTHELSLHIYICILYIYTYVHATHELSLHILHTYICILYIYTYVHATHTSYRSIHMYICRICSDSSCVLRVHMYTCTVYKCI